MYQFFFLFLERYTESGLIDLQMNNLCFSSKNEYKNVSNRLKTKEVKNITNIYLINFHVLVILPHKSI